MSAAITIELKGLRFYACHGLYAEERKTGNEFEVYLAVAFIPDSGIISHLDDTVNYASLYSLLKTEMQNPRDLLETFVMEMTEIIHRSFPRIKKIQLSVTKLHPPIPQFTGTVGVSYSKDY